MKEVIELRINNSFVGLLPSNIQGINLGAVTKIRIEKNAPEYQLIRELSEDVKAKNGESFFYGWGIQRSYSKKELDSAVLFHLIVNNVFEPTGEECGTLYDETVACEICGANRKQINALMLKKGTIPKKDIAKTIGGEVIVSKKFVNVAKQWNIKGLRFGAVNVENYYQLFAHTEIELSTNTITGDNPFEISNGSAGNICNISGYEMIFEKEIYICPKGHLIGLNLLSAPYVLNSQPIFEFDFFLSKQKIGVKRGLLRPEPLYFCSQLFREMIKEERLSGFKLEIAIVE